MNFFTVCKLPLLAQPPLFQWWTTGQCVWWHFELVTDCLEIAFSTCFSSLGFFLSQILKWIFCLFQVIHALSNAYCIYFINKLLSKFDSSCVNTVLFELFAWYKPPTCAWGMGPREGAVRWLCSILILKLSKGPLESWHQFNREKCLLWYEYVLH